MLYCTIKILQKGGRNLTFAIVFDAGKVQPTFEDGFKVESDTTNAVDGLRSWPAIFIRSTRSLSRDTESNHSQRSKGRNKFHSRNEKKVPKFRDRTQGIGLRRNMLAQLERDTSFSYIFDAVTGGGKSSGLQLLESKRHDEYFLPSNQWPNSVWHIVVSMLTDMRQIIGQKTLTFNELAFDRNIGSDLTTTYHLNRISDCMYMVALSCDDKNQSRRKNRGQSEEDILLFMNATALQLSFMAPFSKETIEKAKFNAKEDDDINLPKKPFRCLFC